MNSVHATDALANERTFLAYVRTALALIAFGFVIAKFSIFEHEVGAARHVQLPTTGLSTGLGAVMAAAGIVCGLWGGYRYVVSARALRAGTVSPMSDTVAIVTACAVAIVGVAVAVALPALH
jgi:putative membrane protein